MITTTDLPVIDPMSEEDAEFYATRFRENEAKKQAHIFDWLPSEPSLPGHTLCDLYLRFGKVTTLDKVQCTECIRVRAERIGMGC